MTDQLQDQEVILTDPPLAVSLFNSTRWSWLWLLVRLYLAYVWGTAALGKIRNPQWMVTGEALKGFWEYAVMIPEAPAQPLIAFNWYRAFIQALLNSGSYVWFAKLVAVAEILITVALIAGAFTGLAAFFAGLMNWNFMMAGTAGVNPVLFSLSILLILAWKVAGWWGLDRWLLPAVGTPWQRGRVFRNRTN